MTRPSRRAVMQGAAATLAATTAQAAPARPNILFIMADDLGFADLSCYGRRDYQTPHIDRLAAEGVQLSQAYANSPVCSPTRTALITGRYQYRFDVGLQEPIPLPDPKLGLPAGQPTLPGLLRKAGYRTSLVGKWHLGEIPVHGPLRHGYERFFGIPGGGSDYFTRLYDPKEPSAFDGLWEGEARADRPGYLTDLLAERASAEIAEYARGDKPFFMSLHFTAPHWPWEGPEDEAVARKLGNTRHFDGGSLATYAKMMRSLDDNVGRVLAALKAAGVADNTVVVFTSDNGGERFSDTFPLVGMKGEVLEGGIRVPAIVRWPGRIRAGSKSDQVLASMDWLPTFLSAAGAPAAPATDGENLLAHLQGQTPVRPRKLYWRFKAAEQAAVRDGDWKYVKLGGKESLHNLAVDVRERADLKTLEPERFAALKADFQRWNAAMLPYPEGSNSADPKRWFGDRY